MKLLSIFSTFSLLFALVAQADDDRFADVEINAQQVKDNIYILYGSGGNIGVLTGQDGTLMIDDQFEPLASKIEKSIAQYTGSSAKVNYVVNTHFHGDHTGSNAYFSKSASVIAHENVRKRLAKKSQLGLPVITYEQGVKLHLNNQTVHVKHLSAGHTDGDSVIYFEQSNVWHLGDLFFAARFPFVDKNSGGSVSGLQKNIEYLLTQINDDAKLIPGHGKLTDKKGLERYLSMIKSTVNEVQELKDSGLSVEEIIEKGLSDQWNDWGWNFISEERWIKTLY